MRQLSIAIPFENDPALEVRREPRIGPIISPREKKNTKMPLVILLTVSPDPGNHYQRC